MRQQITGLILAGGQGSRMGGRDKGLVAWAGRPLVAHVIDRLAPQVDRLLLSANRNEAAYRAFGFPVLADRIEGFPGPLAGLHAGLAACASPLLATVPCDAPHLPADLIARLAAALAQSSAPLAIARAGGRRQPVFLLCRREVLAALEAFLAAGGRGVGQWAASLNAAEAQFDDAAAFANINSPDDLDTLAIPGRPAENS